MQLTLVRLAALLRFASWGMAMAATVASTLFLLFGPVFGDRIALALRDACIQARGPGPYCSDPP